MSVSTALRFGAVGVGTTCIHLMVSAYLIELQGFHPAAANGVAFVAANLTSYVANTRWSFSMSMELGNWFRFVLVSVAAFLLTVSIAWAVEIVGGHYLVGVAVIVLFIPILSFTAHRCFTYHD